MRLCRRSYTKQWDTIEIDLGSGPIKGLAEATIG
jgi:hypothetical protein